MKPIRSLLFVPGHKPSWVEKAWNAGPDGLILDLEDSVPKDEKVEARKIVRQILDEAPERKYYCVRVNGPASGLTFDDIEGIAHPNLDAVMVPKVYSARDMERAEEYLTVAERRNGVADGRIALPLLVETAQAMRFTYEFATATPRTDAVMMSAGPGGGCAKGRRLQMEQGGHGNPLYPLQGGAGRPCGFPAPVYQFLVRHQGH